MALDIFILSVLRAGPTHGYELKRRVQRPSLTALSNNSLYPILRRFERAGAVTQTTETQESAPSRKVYAITDVGRALLTELLSTLPPQLAANDEEFLVRLSFFHEIPVQNRRAILAARSGVLDASAAQLAGLIAEASVAEGKTAGQREWRSLAMTQLLARIETEREWIAELAEKAENPK
jgi:DNA-binding PadR family transcriptional regulator